MRGQLLSGVIVAALMIAAALALKWLQGLGLVMGDPQEMASRSFNAMMGLLVVGMANIAPKRLRPLSETRCDPAREQAGRRFTSLVIVLGGLFYTLAWLAAPIELAFPLSITALASAVFVAMAQCLLMVARR